MLTLPLAWMPSHAALMVLAYEDERTDVHSAACRTSGRDAEGLFVQYQCACGFETAHRRSDLDASADLISHALQSARFNVVQWRTDCDFRAVDGEGLTRDMAVSLIACHVEMAQGKSLWGRDGSLVPYLSVARWSMVPQF